MNIKVTTKTLVSAFSSCLLIASFSVTAEDLPRLQFVSGEVFAEDINGQQRVVKKGDVIKPGEKLLTSEGAIAQLRVFGQGIVALRESSEISVTPPVAGKFGVNLDNGLIRTVTSLPRIQGEINVKTPKVVFAVKGGDMQTGLKQADSKSPISLAIAGDVKVLSGKRQFKLEPGTAVSINSLDGGVKTLTKIPTELLLKQPALSTDLKLQTSTSTEPKTDSRLLSDSTFLTSTSFDATRTFSSTETVKLEPVISEPVLDKTYSFELTKVSVDSDGSLGGAEKTALNDSFVLVLDSNTSSNSTVKTINTTGDATLKNTLTSASTRTTLVDGGGTATTFTIKDPVLTTKFKLSSGTVSGSTLLLR